MTVISDNLQLWHFGKYWITAVSAISRTSFEDDLILVFQSDKLELTTTFANSINELSRSYRPERSAQIG
jgi:hypothetical protein